MAYLYILRSKSGRYYIGSTVNLDRRIAEHNSGKTTSLKNLIPVELVFKKFYEKPTEARKMELHLKRLKSKVIMEKIIKDQDIKTHF